MTVLIGSSISTEEAIQMAIQYFNNEANKEFIEDLSARMNRVHLNNIARWNDNGGAPPYKIYIAPNK